MKEKYLNDYEKELIESLESEDIQSVENVKKEIEKHQAYARNTLKKDMRVNIRISSKDLEEIQVTAVKQGLPYQTFMSSVLHKYVTGQLKEKTG
jgi:predicted DNA binding CopG/RHH family protein